MLNMLQQQRLQKASQQAVQGFMLYAYRRMPSEQLQSYLDLYRQPPLQALLAFGAAVLAAAFILARAAEASSASAFHSAFSPLTRPWISVARSLARAPSWPNLGSARRPRALPDGSPELLGLLARDPVRIVNGLDLVPSQVEHV